MKVKSFSRVRLLATPWTAAYQAPPSMGFSKQEYWGGVPLPSPLNSLTKDQTYMPCIRRHILNHWTTRESLNFKIVIDSQAEGNGNPLQYSCLENPMDGGAWWATVHGVAKSRTRLNDFTLTFHFHALEKEMATHSSVLAWRIPGTGEPGGCCLWGHTESDTTEAT